jgi:DNA-binding transcriptional regulator GbsR (MarR family)
MNESEFIRQFWEYNRKNPIGAISVAMYLFLLNIWFKNEENEFKLSDTEICERLNIARQTVVSSRKKLQNIRLIGYQSKNGLAGHYKIVTEFSEVLTSFEIEKSSKKIKEKKEKQNPNFLSKNAIQNLSNNKKNEDKIEFSEKEIPSKEEFLEYAKTLEIYDSSLDFLIEAKYESWLDNSWKNGYDRPISNWKLSLKNTIPYLKNDLEKAFSINPLPKITRPKENLKIG